MDHIYICKQCGYELISYVTPITCTCNEHYCNPCWLSLFNIRKYTKIREKIYKLINGEYVEIEAAYTLEKQKEPTCSTCHTGFDVEKVKDLIIQ